MVESGGAACGFSQVQTRQAMRRATPAVIAAVALLLLLPGPTHAATADEPAAAATLPSATPAPALAGDSAVGPTTPAVAPTPKSGDPARANGEHERQLFMLFLMNSAGPMRPFGSLGR